MRKSSRKSYASKLRQLWTLLLCMTFSFTVLIPAKPAHAVTQKTVSVDFSNELEPMDPKTGYLLVSNYDLPEGRMTPLKPGYCRDDSMSQNFLGPVDVFEEEYCQLVRMKNSYNRLKAVGTEYYPIFCYANSWNTASGTLDSRPNDSVLYKQWVKDLVQYAKDNTMDIKYWDSWNEYTYFMNSQQYFELYNQAWHALKEIMPNAEMIGDSNWTYDYNNAQKPFIDYCEEHGLTADILAWHEFVPINPSAIPEHVSQIRAYAGNKPSVGIKKYSIEEYGLAEVTLSPSKILHYWTYIEESDADFGLKGFWHYANGLSDFVKTDKTVENDSARNKVWWAAKAYAEMSGTRVDVAHEQDGCVAIASKDIGAGEAKILVGNSGTDTVGLTLNLNNQPFAGSAVRIDKYRVTDIENDGLVKQSTETPGSVTNLTTSLSLGADDVWLIVIKKQESAPGSFCLKTPDDATVAVPAPVFTWQPASGAQSYTLKVSENSDLSNPVINVSGIANTSYGIASGLTVGKTYFWSVTAENTHGSTPAAHNMKYTFDVGTNTNVPGRFSMLVISDGATGVAAKPRFTWTTAYNAASYTLTIDNNSDFSSPVANITGLTGNAYTLTTDLSLNATYYAKLTAVNESGTRRMLGPVHTFKTKSGAAPGSFSLLGPASGTGNASRRLNLDWSESNGAFFYRLEIDNNSNFSSPEVIRPYIIATSYTLEPDLLAANTTYYWRVTAYTKDMAYSTAASNNGFSFSTENRPCSPLLKTLNEGDGKVQVFFSPVSGATSYKVKYGTSPGNYTTTISGVTGDSYTVTGLANGTRYYFAVAASNGSTDSTIFNEKSAVPSGTGVLETPVLGNASGGNSKAVLDWNEVPDAAGYVLKYGTSSGNYTETVDAGTETGYTVTGLEPNTRYYFSVMAKGDDYSSSDSADSNEVAVNTTHVVNHAYTASVSISSGFLADSVKDGVVDGYPNDHTKEWFSLGEKENAWAMLTWSNAVRINRVVLFDRPNTTDQVTSGTLTFSDGSSIQVGTLDDDASEGRVVSFSDKTVTWVKFTVNSVKAGAANIGLSEFEALEDEACSHYEAENAAMAGGAAAAADPAASGDALVGYMSSDGSSITFSNTGYGTQLILRYAALNSGTFSLYKNGQHYKDISFQSTGGWAGSGFYSEKVESVSVNMGDTLKLQKDSADVPVNFDYIRLLQSGANIALNKTITSNNSAGTGYDAPKANDGTVSHLSCYIGAADSYPNQITVDLGSVQNVNRVKIKLPTNWGPAWTYTLSILGSTDNVNFDTIVPSGTYTIDPVNGNTAVISFTPTGTRYVRLSYTACSAANAGSAAEFEIYGGVLEAENAVLSGGASVNNNHPGYSGAGFVDGYWNSGAATSFTVNVATTGIYAVRLRYANGMGNTRTLSIYVNGIDVVQTNLVQLADWNTWGDKTEVLYLNAGSNAVAYKYDAGDNGYVNLDYISVQPSS